VKPCILIPCYDHGEPLVALVDDLAALELPCIVVDDGSGPRTAAELGRLSSQTPWLRVERRSSNGGKGAALKVGYRLAASLGYTHALQVDADGQHRAADMPEFLEAARRFPDALILGAPVLEDAPLSRRYGRLISAFWVWVETCSFAIRDPLCGLRCVPLTVAIRSLDRWEHGNRMDFDPELAVRLVWSGTPVVNVKCRVGYPRGGSSHFDMFWDNVRITWLHSRLFFGMLPRLPRLLLRRLAGTRSVDIGARA
jgi:glycosyltransferase involved in cell wall biosynthesis